VIGQTISHYRVIGKLGAGGMGEVYRATDTKLNREVALKVLPEAFAQVAERMARFKREAHLLASLNHPNIAAIYGLEESEGVIALVLELVEGEDLSQRIGLGAIPIEDALALAKQIAEALEAAHDKGIIHRDLKPANIKLTLRCLRGPMGLSIHSGRPTAARSDSLRTPSSSESQQRAGPR